MQLQVARSADMQLDPGGGRPDPSTGATVPPPPHLDAMDAAAGGSI